MRFVLRRIWYNFSILTAAFKPGTRPPDGQWNGVPSMDSRPEQAYQQRRDRVHEQVRLHTQAQISERGAKAAGLDASQLAQRLHIDRTNISKELNELNRDGKLLKQQGRPTLYLDRELIGRLYPDCYVPTVIAKGQSLADFLVEKPARAAARLIQENALDQTIGHDGSLATAIARAKAAVHYPGHGLHILLTGSMGTGKAKFAHDIHDYAVKTGVFEPDAPFIEFNCQDYVFSSQNLISQLVGYARGAIPGNEKGKKGLIEAAAGGILHIEGFHKLPPKAQEMLITIIDRGTFTRLGEPSFSRPAELMLIASSSEPADSPDLARLTLLTPVSIHLPDLDDRDLREKLAHLFLCLTTEAGRIRRPLSIDRESMRYLLSLQYPGNMSQMRSELKKICAMAHIEQSGGTGGAGAAGGSGGQTVEIRFSHLLSPGRQPAFVDAARQQEIASLMSRLDQGSFIFAPGQTYELPPLRPETPAVNLSDILREAADESGEIAIDHVEGYIERCVATLQSGVDLPLPQLTRLVNPLLEQTVRQVLTADDRYGAILGKPHLYYGLLLHLNNAARRAAIVGRKRGGGAGADASSDPAAAGERIARDRDAGTDDDKVATVSGDATAFGAATAATVAAETDPIANSYPNEYAVAERIRQAVQTTFDVRLNLRESRYMTLYLYLSAQWLESSRAGLILACQGTHTAEEMASYANQVLGSSRVRWIRHSGYEALEQTLERIASLVREIDQGAGVILLSDLEPLAGIHPEIARRTGIPVDGITNVSLAQLLDIAQFSMKPGISRATILERASVWSTGAAPGTFAGAGLAGSAEASQQRQYSPLINRIISEVLAKSLTFIDANKVAYALLDALKRILEDLHLPYSDEIAIKFIFHSAVMIERVIRKEPFTYPKLKSFINQHSQLVDLLEKHFAVPAELFGIAVPIGELAFVAEIFIPYMPGAME